LFYNIDAHFQNTDLEPLTIIKSYSSDRGISLCFPNSIATKIGFYRICEIINHQISPCFSLRQQRNSDSLNKNQGPPPKKERKKERKKRKEKEKEAHTHSYACVKRNLDSLRKETSDMPHFSHCISHNPETFYEELNILSEFVVV